MRKIIALATILCAASLAIYFSACKDKKSEPAAVVGTTNADSIKQVLARGEYLTLHVAMCIDCHSKRDFTKYSGPVMPGTEGAGGEEFGQSLGVPGVVYAKNITPDAETGIGTWTDDEIVRAMTQGISKSGDTLFPIMPYMNFNHMAKGDIMSIIAYIRTLKPIKNKIAPRKLMAPTVAFYMPQFLQKSIDANVRPPQTDAVHYGQYMLTFSDCQTCHTPLTPKGPDMTRSFAGGFRFSTPTFTVNSANISPDSATGLGTWTEERFMNKFVTYREEKNYNTAGKLNTYMPLTAYAGMKDEDLKAIYAYLRTVPPMKNKVEKYPTK